MHGIREDHRFVSLDPVHQGLVGLDERRLFRRIQLAGDGFWLAVLHVQPMRQRDQSRPGLVFDSAFTGDPCPHLTGSAGQGGSDPELQFVLLFDCGECQRSCRLNSVTIPPIDDAAVLAA
jgi:hypothetical protein